MGTVVCHEAHFNIKSVNSTEDGGRPSGVGWQEQIPNHLKLLR